MNNLIKLSLLILAILLPTINNAQGLKTGEYAVQNDGSPAIIGQCVQDHLFTRNVYDDVGTTMTYDNVVSFRSGNTQIVEFYLDDDEIYTNQTVQALTPVACTDGGDILYKEITYNSSQFDIYLPLGISLIKYKFPGEKRAIEAQAGDRLPYDASVSWSLKDYTKTIDGIEYNVYTVLITNQKNDACHFSGNEDVYIDNGYVALKKDDAYLFRLAIFNANQDQAQGLLSDMIIANQEFGIREANINWGTDPNKCRYIYGTGGNNQSQRFQLYNRVSLYGSEGMDGLAFEVNGIYYIKRNNNSLSVTYRRDGTYYQGNIIIPKNVYYNGVNYTVTSIGSNAFKDCSRLASITIPQTIVSIGSYAFRGCSALEIVNYNAVSCANFSSIPSERPFYGLNISTINIGGEVTRIPSYFADGLTKLKQVKIPSSVISVGEQAFYNNPNIEAVTCRAETPPSWDSGEMFSTYVYNHAPLYVPVHYKNEYLIHPYWGKFFSIIGIGDDNEVLATSITLNRSNLSLIVGNSSQLQATILPENATNKTVLWTSSNESVALVDNNGLVTSVAAGNAIITATTTDGTDLSATCTVTVSDILATSIILNTNSLTLDVDEISRLIATIFPSNATNKEVVWTSSNPSVASVDNYGFVTAISPGSVIIKATTTDGSNLSATCNVNVVRHATSISLNHNDLSLYVYQTSQLTATVYPSNATNKTVAWESSNPAAATVNSNGLVTAIAAGTTVITATTTDGSGLSASCVVTVSIIPVSSISLNNTSLTLDIEDTYKLIESILPSNATYKSVTWYSSNPAVAIVSSDGLVSPKSPGDATITATTTDGTNLSASCQVTVIKRVKSVILNETNIILTLPEATQLIATTTPIDATNPVLRWTSSNSAVATVDDFGYIKSIGVGTTIIRAATTDGSNLSASCQVTVRKQYVSSIDFNESKLVMHIGDTYQLVADVAPENASDKTLSWYSENTSVAGVNNNGLVTALAGGTTYIRASATDGSNVSANCEIEVIPDYFLVLDTISCIRGELSRIVDLPVSLVNKNLISGIQFDVTLPSGVEFNYIDDSPDVWLDDARKTRSHSISASQLSNGKYRILITSSSSKDLRGNDGVLAHMNLLMPQQFNIGYKYISVSNIIASESDETRHTLDNKSTMVNFYYIVGDADANAIVDIADHAATSSKILGRSPSPFYSDAANVDGNSSLDVVDLVGITNIALEIKPITLRQAPTRGGIENHLFCDRLKLDASHEQDIIIGIDCGFDFAGFQMDVKLPRGLRLISATLSDEASELGLATELMQDGRIRILATSFSETEVSGICPKLLTLKVNADRSYIPGSNIELTDILFAERNLTGHYFDAESIEYIQPSFIYELLDEARIYVENGNIIVETPVAGLVRLISIDGYMVEYQAQIGRNEYIIAEHGIYIINFNGKTIKVRL